MTSGQRNVRKRNPKRAASFEQQLATARTAVEELRRKSQKIPEDNDELEKLQARVKHLSKKLAEKSELHARQGKRH